MKQKIIVNLLFFCSFQAFSQSSHLWCLGYAGGANNSGAILQADSAGSNFHAVYSFVDSLTNGPVDALTSIASADMFGAAISNMGSSSLYRYDPYTNNYALVSNFINDTIGYNIESKLVLAPNGKLYGITANGCGGYSGAIFSIDTSTNQLALVHTIKITDGQGYGTLYVMNDSIFYGLGYAGGMYGYGTIYSYNVNSDSLTVLFNFNDTLGAKPYLQQLLMSANGKFYGLCAMGGANDDGVLFSFDPSANTYTKLFDFTNSTGVYPMANLIQATDGKLYGMTNFGLDTSSQLGVIFSFDTGTNTFTKLLRFDTLTGFMPQRGLMQASNGLLYATTKRGGSNLLGTVFSFDIHTNTFTKLLDGDTVNGGSFDSEVFETFGTPALGTGIKEALNNNDILTVYPNPSSNTLTISNTGPRITRTEVSNVLGQMVMAADMHGSSISTAGLPQGMYYLKATDDMGNIYCAEFAKE